MPELAETITITRRQSEGVKINVDGEEFPWYTGDGNRATRVEVSRNDVPGITVFIPCKSVLVEDTL